MYIGEITPFTTRLGVHLVGGQLTGVTAGVIIQILEILVAQHEEIDP